jgi:cellulose biosynthesis protein BcsQ
MQNTQTHNGRTVFFGNYKGGVGKTTSTYNMAVELAKHFNKKVLLIDLDPQSSLSEVCMTAYGTQQLDEIGKKETLNYIYTVYMQARKIGNIKFTVPSRGIIKQANSISFIPNSLFSELGGLDKISMDIGKNIENILILKDFIEENKLNMKYDYIFFDCPPSNNLITQSAFLYSDYYIIPTIMDPLSSKGVKHYISVIREIYKSYCDIKKNEAADVLSLLFGNEPQLVGVFETMRKGNTITSQYRNMIKSEGYYLFENEIKDRKNVSESMGDGSETSNYEYVHLAEEFMKRIGEMESV